MIKHYPTSNQAYGEFNGGDITENKPLGFPQDGGNLKPYSNLFYWAHAVAKKDSVIGLHPHRGFEIMSIVLEGNIQHYDTLLRQWIPLEKGDVQLIQSGSGISHAEAMQADSKIFQIWFNPDLRKTLSAPAKYLDVKAKDLPKENNITTIVGENSTIRLDSENIEITEIAFEVGNFQLPIEKEYYYSFYLIEGGLKIQQVRVQKDDFFIVEDEESLSYEVLAKGRMLCIKSPVTVSYPVY
jgi:redox-sensitive bicupin YhaK (pirin superfamily)